MAKRKGCGAALAPLNKRNPKLHKEISVLIKSFGVMTVCREAGVSDVSVYNLITGSKGISGQTEKLIFEAVTRLRLTGGSPEESADRALERALEAC